MSFFIQKLDFSLWCFFKHFSTIPKKKLTIPKEHPAEIPEIEWIKPRINLELKQNVKFWTWSLLIELILKLVTLETMSVSKVNSNHFLHFFLSFLFDKLNAFVLLLQGVVEKAAGIGQVCKALFIPLSLFILTRCMGEKKKTNTQRKNRYF